MVIRPIAREERWQAELVMAAAYEYGVDPEKEKENAKKEPDVDGLRWEARNRALGAFDENGRLFSHVNSREYSVRFDGTVQKMGGIGGVATLPAYRRSGAVRALMEDQLRDMYARGFGLSALYPFSNEFYRKFGYECGAMRAIWKLSLSALPRWPQTGTVEQIFPDGDFSPLLEVYNICFAETNLSALRDVYNAALQKPENWNGTRYVYVWRDSAGVPGGLMISKKKETKDGAELNCTCDFGNENGFLFRDAEALHGLLSFAKSAFSSDYATLRFTVPANIPLQSLLGENYETQCELSPNGMLRVVDAEKILRAARCRGKGTLVLRIEDGVIPENCGTFALTFGEGENRVARVDAQPDAVLSIGAFSALILGARPDGGARWENGARILRKEAPFDGVFYGKPCFLLDLF